MSMITEQVERLRELAEQDKLGLIPWNGYSKILNQAADTIEQLAAKVRAEEEIEQKCHSCKHYTRGEYDGSCGSYICKEYSGWEDKRE